MKVAIALTVVLIVALPVNSFHKYNFTTDNIPRLRYLPVEDKNGNIHYEDLWQKFVPLNAVTENVRMYLYTPKNPEKPVILPADGSISLFSTHFNADLDNFILVHGWTKNYEAPMNVAIKSAIQNVTYANIFVVDWSDIAENSRYNAAAAEVKNIGEILGNYIHRHVMTLHNLSSSKFRFICHSMGAHICGGAGARIKALSGSLVASIVALDPAAPGFEFPFWIPSDLPFFYESESIDTNDASFVQVIHTSFFLGFTHSIGHADYFPNGWLIIVQPGCPSFPYIWCSHSRAFEFYAESIYPSSNFTSRSCNREERRKLLGSDDQPVSLMGQLYVDTEASGRYCLDTNSEPPYAQVKSYLRHYDSEEKDPFRIHFMPEMDENGTLTAEDLWQDVIALNATAKDVTIYLYTPKNPTEPSILPVAQSIPLSDTPFNPSFPTFFITHGWRNNYESSINSLIKAAILNVTDANVFVNDWSPIAGNILYKLAALEVENVGQVLGNYIYDFLIAPYNISSSELRLIGHSLGAHISGVIASQIKVRSGSVVASVVALDPAAPLFGIAFPDDTIDISYAAFVQVIHTSHLGIHSALGHADYYPNCGKMQPGCGLDIAAACSHSRAYEFYAESIYESTTFTSLLCQHFWAYVLEFCTNNPQSFMGGLYVDTK
ncbi:lipase [Holotrichia oblita]|uniref:Lipase n=1 Tax=Holotrichia oblita TaxID=644536 RepID=A0ACB9TPP4_HOLOL|nr:lipase [Holotrichia oblita]